MFVIEGNGRKTDVVWEHIKKYHTGDKVCVVGFSKKLPENYLRRKQLDFYEMFPSSNWLLQAESFIRRFINQYDGIVFYVDCSSEEMKTLFKISEIYRRHLMITVTVATEGDIIVKEINV